MRIGFEFLELVDQELPERFILTHYSKYITNPLEADISIILKPSINCSEYLLTGFHMMRNWF